MSDGYFDLQVNGYAGVDFNSDALSEEQLHHACTKLREHGVDGILATVITEEVDVMCRRIARIAELRDKNSLIKDVVCGLHIEGPFISPANGYRGAHPADAIRPADEEVARRLLGAGGGTVRVFTLAPECDAGSKVTKILVSEKIVVSAGHTNASLDELREAIQSGLSMFTHLGNGCPMVGMDRHDNIIQRALSLSGQLWLTFIADGSHITWPALGNYFKAAGIERSIVVTDAIAPASLGPGEYVFSRWRLKVGRDGVARSADGTHLVGAVVTMKQSAQNLRSALQMDEPQCKRLLSINPRRSIGL
jgi:N-acetylglucosamine-6-phosphate deacetylase